MSHERSKAPQTQPTPQEQRTTREVDANALLDLLHHTSPAQQESTEPIKRDQLHALQQRANPRADHEDGGATRDIGREVLRDLLHDVRSPKANDHATSPIDARDVVALLDASSHTYPPVQSDDGMATAPLRLPESILRADQARREQVDAGVWRPGSTPARTKPLEPVTIAPPAPPDDPPARPKMVTLSGFADSPTGPMRAPVEPSPDERKVMVTEPSLQIHTQTWSPTPMQPMSVPVSLLSPLHPDANNPTRRMEAVIPPLDEPPVAIDLPAARQTPSPMPAPSPAPNPMPRQHLGPAPKAPPQRRAPPKPAIPTWALLVAIAILLVLSFLITLMLLS